MTTRTELQMSERSSCDYGSQYNQLISRRIREIGVSGLKSHKIALKVRISSLSGLSSGGRILYEDGSLILTRKFLG